MLRSETGCPLPGGGVCGSVKLKTPSNMLAVAAVYSGIAVCSGTTPVTLPRNRLMNNPATIQPTVPKTRIKGNCCSCDWMWWNARLFARPSVGM